MWKSFQFKKLLSFQIFLNLKDKFYLQVLHLLDGIHANEEPVSNTVFIFYLFDPNSTVP